ncbi:hypothetical protein NT01EI_2723 [Edwardsiella ictaluri 93-146]|uniref:Uncharacterized protein n=1 Tax=Edwardsiella ictaluri (strain 93-146) TaxID=634503 RepID=C5B8N2_EDWI9|nr:hypothetical protein NT01EI_2723 [Edwardsiella ictaluri 93-146]STP81613.1 Uncharacterised protein [Edwardsiella ictaluri]
MLGSGATVVRECLVSVSNRMYNGGDMCPIRAQRGVCVASQ